MKQVQTWNKPKPMQGLDQLHFSKMVESHWVSRNLRPRNLRPCGDLGSEVSRSEV